MTVEIMPVGVKCNLKCTYCYQEPMRDAGNFGKPLKFDKMIDALDKVGQDFALFGGEALLTPMSVLEKFFEYGYSKYRKNGIQTNGLLISDAHIELFKKYNVWIGISIDGPPNCNAPRSDALDTQRIINNIQKCIDNNIIPSLIVTIHKTNVFYLQELLDFFDEMEYAGIRYINLHNLEDDNCSGEALSNDDNYEAFRKIYDYSKRSAIKFVPYSDIKALLTSVDPSVSCIWNTCDSYNTAAVYGIGPEGELTNCGRTNKDGVDWLKADISGRERYVALYNTPQEHGGCSGCKYFYACKGNCPGTAIDGDWRNRTKDCSFWYQLIEHIETDLISQGIPVIADESKFRLGARLADISHGDSPHGDSHGDHTDRSRQPQQIFEGLIKSGHAKRIEGKAQEGKLPCGA